MSWASSAKVLGLKLSSKLRIFLTASIDLLFLERNSMLCLAPYSVLISCILDWHNDWKTSFVTPSVKEESFPSPSGGMYGSKTAPVADIVIGRSIQERGGRIPCSFILDLIWSGVNSEMVSSSRKFGSFTFWTYLENLHIKTLYAGS